MHHRCIESAATVELLVPAHGVVIAIFTALVGFFVDFKHDVDFGRDVFEAVELIRPLKFIRHPFSSPVVFQRDNKLPFLHIIGHGVIQKIRSCQTPVPRPFILRIGGRVNTYIAAPRLNIPFESTLLLVVEHIASRIQKHDRIVFFQIGFIELRRIFCKTDTETFFSGHFCQGFFARFDRLVPKSRRLAKDEQVEFGRLCP